MTGRAFAVAVAALVVTTASSAGTTGGRLVFATGGDGVVGNLEIASVAPDGTGFTKLTHQSPTGWLPRWTSDGRGFVFTSYDPAVEEGALWRVAPDGTGFTRLPGSSLSVASPDGRLVASYAARGIVVQTSGGKRVRTLRVPLGDDDFYDGGIVWSPDARYIAVDVATDSDTATYVRTFVLQVDGHAAARALSPKAPDRFDYALSFSPDERTVLVDTSPSSDYSTIVLVRRDGRGRHRLAQDGAGSGAHAWSPRGDRVAYVGRAGGILVADTHTLKTKRLVATRSIGDEIRSISLAWSKDGKRLAFSDYGGIYLVDANDGHLRRLTPRGSWSDLDWAPDGRRIVFANDAEIFVADAATGVVRQVTAAIDDDSPMPSPDGSRIAFIRGPRGLVDASRISVWVAAADGTGAREVGRGYDPVWSPDGRHLAYVDAFPEDESWLGTLRPGRIVVADIDGRTETQVAVGTAPTWAPDGTRLAYVRYTFAERSTWRGVRAWPTSVALSIVGVDGSSPRTLLTSTDPLFRRPQWSPSGKEIAVIGPTLALVDAETGEIRMLAQQPTDVAWSPDGSQLLTTNEYPDELAIVDVGTDTARVIDAERESFRHHAPTWSPDGTRVGFVGCSTADTFTCDVYVVGVDGNGRTRVTRTQGIEGALVWGR